MQRTFTSDVLSGISCAALVGALAIAGCSSANAPTSPGSATEGGSGSPGAGGSGSLAIHITDSPFSEAKALLVTFSSVSVHRSEDGGWQTIPFASGSTRTCDLKKLDGPTDVLGVGSLPAGHYTQVRLVVSSATLHFDNATSGPACAPSIAPPAGESAAIDVPSGEVKVNHQFTVESGASTMLLDFDGDQSVRQTGSGNGNATGSGNANGNGRGGSSDGSSGGNTRYMMSPVIRVVSVQ
jgi:hypothetical protein